MSRKHRQGNNETKCKIAIRALQEYRIRFNPGNKKYIGQGAGNTVAGTVLAVGNAPMADLSGAGNEEGYDHYDDHISIAQLGAILFEELELPNLQDRKKQFVTFDSCVFNDIREAGPMPNVDKRRTLLANLRRNARQGQAIFKTIQPDDVMYKSWDLAQKMQTNAVILAMMDTSGSMGAEEKYIARGFFFWLRRFLSTKYEQVQMVYLVHHTKAKEVAEEEFFAQGESGGTKCSTVYQLAWQLIEQRFSPREYNLYLFHFSDGDNLPSDNEKCLELVQKILPQCSFFGYGEIMNPYDRTSKLYQTYQTINSANFKSIMIKDSRIFFPFAGLNLTV